MPSLNESRKTSNDAARCCTWTHLSRLHVPPPNFRTVRSCGLYAPNAAKRELVGAALGQLPEIEPRDGISAEIPDQAAEDTGYGCCEVCGKKLVFVAKLPRPPPKRPATRRTQA